jgi:hypothetical protein
MFEKLANLEEFFCPIHIVDIAQALDIPDTRVVSEFCGKALQPLQNIQSEYVRTPEGNDKKLVIPENAFDLLVEGIIGVAVHREIIDVVYGLDAGYERKKEKRDEGARQKGYPRMTYRDATEISHGWVLLNLCGKLARVILSCHAKGS